MTNNPAGNNPPTDQPTTDDDPAGSGSDAVGTLAMITVDCADADVMARFWSAMLGATITHNEGDYSMISMDGVSIGFGRTPDYRPPTWPDHGHKQFHLDLSVEDRPEAEARAVVLGATRPAEQPADADRWTVLLDPSGHPFCLVG